MIKNYRNFRDETEETSMPHLNRESRIGVRNFGKFGFQVKMEYFMAIVANLEVPI